MNRLNHLKKTLIRNIDDNISYENLEFILLDYNSSDGMDNWVKLNLKNYLKSRVLKYYRTNQPDFFDRAHSRNVAMKLASGRIVCNLDADNFLGKDFAHFINYHFSYDEDIFLTSGKYNGSYGRVCLKKSDFMHVRGYDEDMSGWGYEDEDLYSRLSNYGLERIKFLKPIYVKSIEHGNELNYCNDASSVHSFDIYLKQDKCNQSTLLFLSRDNTFKYGVVKRTKDLGMIVLKGDWEKGTFLDKMYSIQLKFTSKKELYLEKVSENKLANSESSFFLLVRNELLKSKILKLITILENKSRSQKKPKGTSISNQKTWGKATLEYNFSSTIDI